MNPSRQQFSRQDRIRKALAKEVGQLLTTDLKVPALQDVVISVTEVELSNDMRHAKVFISILADPAEQETHMALLTELTPKIRHAVGQRIRLRYTPEIHLVLDHSLERGTRVTQLLNQIARGEV